MMEENNIKYYKMLDLKNKDMISDSSYWYLVTIKDNLVNNVSRIVHGEIVHKYIDSDYYDKTFYHYKLLRDPAWEYKLLTDEEMFLEMI